MTSIVMVMTLGRSPQSATTAPLVAEDYLQQLVARDWVHGAIAENGRLKWEIEIIRHDFNSAARDAQFHRARADLAERHLAMIRAGSSYRLGRLLTSVPRTIRRIA